MPKERSENTEAINLKVPLLWVQMAEELAAVSEPVRATRTAILRVALGQGLAAMMDRRKRKRAKTK